MCFSTSKIQAKFKAQLILARYKNKNKIIAIESFKGEQEEDLKKSFWESR